MHEIIKPGIVLFVITAIAAVCLGFVQDITKVPIERQQVEAKAASMQTLLPSATDFKEEVEIPEGSAVFSVTTGYANGNVEGYVLGVAPKGYAGPVEMLVGIDAAGVLTGVQVANHSETPGLGAKAEEPEFTDRFIGKSGELIVTKSGMPDDNEIQAITSATITSRAVTIGVNDALSFFHEYIE